MICAITATTEAVVPAKGEEEAANAEQERELAEDNNILKRDGRKAFILIQTFE
jgi:hypothetical protein